MLRCNLLQQLLSCIEHFPLSGPESSYNNRSNALVPEQTRVVRLVGHPRALQFAISDNFPLRSLIVKLQW
jgi:hypothetical protein